MDSMFIDFGINLGASIIYDFGKKALGKLSKKEAVKVVLKKIDAYQNMSDFPERYVETLVELRFGNKPKQVLDYFRDKDVMKALYNFYYASEDSGLRRNENDFESSLNHYFQARKTGDDIKELNLNFKTEVSDFRNLFQQKIHESRTVSEIDFYDTVKDIQKTTDSYAEILKELKQRNIESAVNQYGKEIFNIGDIDNATFNIIINKAGEKLPKRLNNKIPMLSEDKIVGRKEILDELHKLMFNNEPVVVVNGLGGIGKTTIAQVYTGKYYKMYQHIIWITQTAGNDIYSQFVSTPVLLKNLKIEGNSNDPKGVFNEIILKLNQLDDKPNLLIIDNADESVEEIRDILPDTDKWHMLITSRIELNGYTIKPLDFLSKNDAVLLFTTYYKRNNLSSEQISEIVETFDYHTLSIEILAKTANLIEYNFDELQKALQNNIEVDLTDVKYSDEKKSKKITNYLTEIFAFSNMSEEELSILKKLSFLPSDYISYETIKELIIEDQSFKKLRLILEKLYKKGWILKDEKNDSYKIHLIISEVIHKKTTVEFKELINTIKVLTKKLYIDQAKDNPVDKFQWVEYGKIIISLIDVHPPFDANEEKIVSEFQNNLALVLQALGDYTGAKELLEKALISSEKNFGKDHPTTAVSYSNLATVLQALGDYTGAKELLGKALISSEKNFGKDHPTTAVRYSNLAIVLQALGDYTGAKELLEKALISSEKNFGKDHPTTAVSYSNLAVVLQDLGDYTGAKELLEKAIISDEKNFGKDHPTTAVSYSNLAVVLQDLGDYTGAKDLLEKVLISDEKNFGKDHPTTAVSYSNLATVLKALGDYTGAKDLLGKALISDEKDFGKEHPTTAVRYSNLALVLKDLGDYTGAKELLEKALISSEKNFGKDHPTTAVSYSNLAVVLQDLGDYTGAKDFLEKALILSEKNFGKDHPTTAVSYSNLAVVLQDLGDYTGAKDFLEKALISDEKNFGKEHPTTAVRYSNLALVLKDLGDYTGAKDLLEKALISDEKNSGKEHPNTAVSYSNLALVLKDLGDYTGAKELLEKALISDEKNFGKEHPNTAVRYSNLALVLQDLGDYTMAKDFLEKAYSVFLKVFGDNHPSSKIIKGNLDYIVSLIK